MAGIGKTTLAKELFNRKQSNYSKASFLFDMREASVKNELPSLQRKLLTDLFYVKNHDFRNIEDGKSHIKDCLKGCRFLNFLIVLDDIDHTEQLDALLIKDILAKSNNSLIIVTTRDVGVLITADITVGYKLRRMDANDGRELFSWHAFGQPRPRTEYEALVDEFVELCGGLPLSLQVLGRHVHGRDLSYWKLELSKARTTLPRDVLKRLKISFDSLDNEQKQVFIDTACFFVGHKKSVAETAWKLSGWNGQHALETLIDKCLVEELQQPGLSTVLRMHDQLRDLGRELARELSPPAPRRLWRPQELQSLESMDFKTMPTTTNIRCFCSFVTEPSIDLRFTFLLGELDSFVQTSACLLWLDIEDTSVEEEHTIEDAPAPLYGHTIEHTIEEEEHTMENKVAQMLFLMRIGCGEIVIPGNFDVRAAMGGLEKLTRDGEHCRSKIIISGSDYPGLQFIRLHNIKNLVEVDLRMVKTLKFLHITKCKNLQSVSGISDLPNLVELRMIGCESLVELKILRCPELKEMPVLMGLNCLERIAIDGCGFPELLLKNCPNLRKVSAKFQFTAVHICTCPQLEELSICLPRSSSSLKQFMIHTCEKLENIAGIENLHVQEYIGLTHCNAMNCIQLLKSLPSQGLDIVGRAVDGAESILNANLFYEANGGVDGVYQIGIDQNYPKWSELSTVIACFLVVVDRMTLVEDIYQSLRGIKGVYLNEGEWIYTMVTCNGSRHTYYLTAHMEDILQKKGILKKGFRVEVRKSEEWNSLSLLHTIVDRLYHL